MSVLPNNGLQQTPPSLTLGLGAYYALDNLAGIGRRTAALVVDLGIVFVVCGVVIALGPELGVSQNVANALGLSLAWLYLAGLKARPTGTLGYRVANVQLVDLQGKPANLWKSTCRFLFLFGGPINLLFDLIWLTNDSNRQTLRDKLTGTYVIRRGAQPLGRGPITYPTYFIATLSFIVPNVSRGGANPPAGGPTPG